jgi:hypothetical protein
MPSASVLKLVEGSSMVVKMLTGMLLPSPPDMVLDQPTPLLILRWPGF